MTTTTHTTITDDTLTNAINATILHETIEDFEGTTGIDMPYETEKVADALIRAGLTPTLEVYAPTGADTAIVTVAGTAETINLDTFIPATTAAGEPLVGMDAALAIARGLIELHAKHC